MSTNQVQQFVGTMPVPERLRFDVASLERYMRANVEGYSGEQVHYLAERKDGDTYAEVRTKITSGKAEIPLSNVDGALTLLEKNNSSEDKDLLYYFEKGELLRAKGDLTGSQAAWHRADLDRPRPHAEVDGRQKPRRLSDQINQISRSTERATGSVISKSPARGFLFGRHWHKP